VQIAAAEGWRDHRLAFSHFALGRIAQHADPQLARRAFERADRIYADVPGGALHRAFVGAQLAAYALAEGDAAQVRRLTERHLPVAKRHENAMLLATLMMLRAEALEMQGHRADARAVRLDSLGWARYGFGPEWAVRAKLREIAALDPTDPRG
jgi:ATP/maltotriose-dependent transcriptional regulator MalT